MSPILHVTIRWPAIAILLPLALIILATLSSIAKSLRDPREHFPCDDAPESDYYIVDIDEAEKRGREPGADSGSRVNNQPPAGVLGSPIARSARPVA